MQRKAYGRDAGLSARMLLTTFLLGLLYVGLNVASGVVSGADDYLSTYVSQRFLVGLRRDVFAHVLSLPAAAHDRRRLGDTLTRLTSDVAAVERFMVSQVSEGVGALVRLLVLVGALVWMDWRLALASLVVAPLAVALRYRRERSIVSDGVALSAGFAGAIAASAPGPFPVPLLGFSPSMVLGTFAGVGALLAVSRSTVAATDDDRVRAARAATDARQP